MDGSIAPGGHRNAIIETGHRGTKRRLLVEYLGPILGIVGIVVVAVLIAKAGSGCGG
jgi:hypothetical protein